MLAGRALLRACRDTKTRPFPVRYRGAVSTWTFVAGGSQDLVKLPKERGLQLIFHLKSCGIPNTPQPVANSAVGGTARAASRRAARSGAPSQAEDRLQPPVHKGVADVRRPGTGQFPRENSTSSPRLPRDETFLSRLLPTAAGPHPTAVIILRPSSRRRVFWWQLSRCENSACTPAGGTSPLTRMRSPASPCMGDFSIQMCVDPAPRRGRLKVAFNCGLGPGMRWVRLPA